MPLKLLTEVELVSINWEESENISELKNIIKSIELEETIMRIIRYWGKSLTYVILQEKMFDVDGRRPSW